MGIRAVIFDLDELLIDSEPYWQMADREFFDRRGEKYSQKEIAKFRGMGSREVTECLINDYGFAGSVDNLLLERRDLLYKFLMKDLRFMEGAFEMIEFLHRKNMKMAVATGGHTRERADLILREMKVGRFFELIVSSDDVKQGKPLPDVFVLTAEKLGVAAVSCLVFEDSVNGVLAGVAALMRVYGVNKDEDLRWALNRAGAERVFESFAEIER